MPDVFDANIVCDCGGKTQNVQILKDDFSIRAKQCMKCGKKWHHPVDLQEYKEFEKLKEKEFSVKLRFVGNSFCVSIPREIIDFQEEMAREMDKMIRMSLESPERLTLYFNKKLKRRQL